jgi:ATP-dependent DNA helicase DinG
MIEDTPAPSRPVLLPDAPALIAGVRGVVWLSADGEVETMATGEVARALQAEQPPIICHSKSFFARLGLKPFAVFDVLELYAFVRPAEFTLPTPRGLAEVLGLSLPTSHEQEAESLMAAAHALISELATMPRDRDSGAIAWAMQRGGWRWAEPVLAALGAGERPHSGNAAAGLAVWERLSEWNDRGPETPPRDLPVEPVEARAQLVKLLGHGAEDRPGQADYAGAVAPAFDARNKRGEANVVLADAGTGVGKTMGYIAPASVWAEKNEGAVWISTFTRNLQRQLDAELDRLYPDPTEKIDKVVIRKGRENYFCLLNFAEATGRLRSGAGVASEAIGLGLMARWALISRDGDMIGGDFPSWLADLVGRGSTLDLTDKRGECTYSACQHYSRCFIERTIRRARGARIVVANHALVMVQAAMGGGGGEEGQLPTRYVFDEGHHIFGAADSAFSADLTGFEAEDLRRWLLGAEAGRHSRSRGLAARMEDLIAGDDEATAALDEALRAARVLPGPAWRQRVSGGEAVGPTEAFLALVRQQVYARETGGAATYSLEAGTESPVPGLLEAAGALESALIRLRKPLQLLIQSLVRLLDVEADTLDSATRNRIEAVSRGLQRRGVDQLNAWAAMLKALHNETPEEVIDWFGVERIDGREVDVGLHRHYVDPTLPFAETVLGPAHGALITSATLRDHGPEGGDEPAHMRDQDDTEDPSGWAGAEARTGSRHLPAPAILAAVDSPFDYAGRTRVLVVGDVDKSDMNQVAAAYRELFQASGGGGLGLFTAISRLRAVHDRIVAPLDEVGMQVLAQHVEALDTGTLIDIFRAEEDSCLLGTDAVRDGVDVPGRSLRLIVFDRVPWPRPDILHRARRAAFGGRAYDETLTRLKLKQAYGRLIRRANDKGVFVMLDRALPSRLLNAFPEGVQASRVGLKEAVMEIRGFLADDET